MTNICENPDCVKEHVVGQEYCREHLAARGLCDECGKEHNGAPGMCRSCYNNTCIHDDCNKTRATGRRFCKEHAPAQCIWDNCTRYAVKGVHCEEHDASIPRITTSNVRYKFKSVKCGHIDCDKEATPECELCPDCYNQVTHCQHSGCVELRDDDNGEYCKYHHLQRVARGRRPECDHDDCVKEALWLDHSHEGESHLRCDDHSGDTDRRYSLVPEGQLPDARIDRLEKMVKRHTKLLLSIGDVYKQYLESIGQLPEEDV